MTLTSASQSPRAARLIALALVALALGVYWEVRQHDFVNLDDDLYVYENPVVRHGLTLEGVRWAFTADLTFETPWSDYWLPLTHLSRMLDIELFGLNPAGHHLVNVLLHAANVLLLFAILRRATGTLWPSAAAAAAFAVHPMHVESVAWITERKDVLSGLFWFVALWFYVAYVQRHRARHYLASLAAFAIGLLAKPAIVTLPAALLLLDVWPLRRTAVDAWRTPAGRAQWRRLLVEKLPFAALAAMAVLVTVRAARGSGTLTAVEAHGPLLRAATVINGYAGYLRRFVWPSRLAVIYPFEQVPDPLLTALALLGLAALTVGCLALWRRAPAATVGWIWFGVVMLPMSGLMQVGPQALADRFAYLPYTGLYLLMGWGVPALLPSGRGRTAVLGGAAGVALLLLAWRTVDQVGHWRDSETLFRHTVAVTNRNSLALNNLGGALLAAGRDEDAIRLLREAYTISPRFAAVHVNLGATLRSLGRLDEAARWYRRALTFDPHSRQARINLGEVLMRQGRTDEALAEYEKAVAHGVITEGLLLNYASALQAAGQVDAAIARCREALALKPDYVEAHINLGAYLIQAGELEAATAQFRTAIALAPDLTEVRLNLANVYMAQDNLAAAAEQFHIALRRQPNLPDALSNLGIIATRRGDLAEAVRCFEATLRLDPDQHAVGVNLARVLNRLGKPDLAAAAYAAVLQRQPAFEPAILDLAWLLATSPVDGVRSGPRARDLVAPLVENAAAAAPARLLDIAAAAYAECGEFARAVSAAEQAAAVAVAAGDTALAQSIAARLAQYRAGQQFREPLPKTQ